MDQQSLNEQFGIKDQLEFVVGKGDLVMAQIHNKFAQARISLYAGQVMSYLPAGVSEDLMFNSKLAYYEAGKSIKGGAPVCWPWFGPDPEDKGRPAHGFARTSQWSVVKTSLVEDGATCLTLQLTPNQASQAIWEHDFVLTLDVIVGKTLELTLTTSNKSNQAISITQALHTYFNIGDIAKTTVEGLEGKNYIDKVDQGKEKTQQGSIIIDGEVDRIYTNVSDDLVINDQALARKISIQSTGSNSAVVWNPWAEKAADMGDLNDDDYKNMLCVETTNAAVDCVEILPGQSHSLVAKYKLL